jgi:hypothetical protein
MDGKKTYLVAIGAFVMGLYMLAFQGMPWQEAINYFLASGGLAAMRHGLGKIEVKEDSES